MISHLAGKIIVVGGLATGLYAGPCSAGDALPCNDLCSAYLAIPAEDAPAAEAQAEDVTRSRIVKVDATGVRAKMVDYFYAVNEDCSSSGGIQIGILQQPAGGTLSEGDARDRVFFPAHSTRAACNKRRAPSVRLIYERSPEFTGSDEFVVRVEYPNGEETTMKYEITARR